MLEDIIGSSPVRTAYQFVNRCKSAVFLFIKSHTPSFTPPIFYTQLTSQS